MAFDIIEHGHDIWDRRSWPSLCPIAWSIGMVRGVSQAYFDEHAMISLMPLINHISYQYMLKPVLQAMSTCSDCVLIVFF